jgi:chitinase
LARLIGQIDYEFPKSPSDAHGYVSLLHELRAALEQLALSKGRRQGQYQLTVAAPCGWDNMQILRVKEMDSVLDFWNLMVSGISFSGQKADGTGLRCALVMGYCDQQP